MIFGKSNNKQAGVIHRLAPKACGVAVMFAGALLIGAGTLVAQSRQPASPAPVAPQHANQRKVNADATATSNAPPADAASAMRYAYEFKQPQFLVSSISIEHDATGRGRMTFTKRNMNEPFTESITLSPPALARITDLWTKLNLLKDAPALQAEKQFPHLGTMKLRVTDAGETRAAEFNWTQNPAAAALAAEYRRLADQTLFVFDINVARENQSLETPAIMKRLEILVRRKELSDPAQLVPLLRDLSTDERLPLIARNQASGLLKKLN